MKKNLVSLTAAMAATLLASGAAQAQTCAGYPTGMMGLYFGARADFPTDLNSFGAEAAVNLPGALGLHGGVNVISVEDVEDSDVNFFFVGGSLDIASISTPIVGPSVSACPVVEVHFADDDGDTFTAIPFGLGIGASLGIPGIAADGYVQPRVILSRTNYESDLLDDDNDTDFAVKAGAAFGFGLITVGGEINHIFNGGDPTFGIRAGIRL